MKTTIQWINALRAVIAAERGIEPEDVSGATVAGYLQVTPQGVSSYLTGRTFFDPTSAARCAELLGVDPLQVIASAEAERAKDAERRAFWRRIGGAAAGLVLALGLFDSTQFPAQAAERPAADRFTHYASIVGRQLARIAQATRTALASWLGSVLDRAALGAL